MKMLKIKHALYDSSLNLFRIPKMVYSSCAVENIVYVLLLLLL